MARPRKGTHQIPTDERILSAAESAFGELGFEGAKLADIAAEASIRRPSLLYHFGTKDALYSAVVQRLVTDLKTSLLESFVPQDDLELRVMGLMRTFVEFAEGRQAFAPIVLRGIVDGRGPMREILGRELVPLLDLVESWLAAGTTSRTHPDLNVRSAVLHLCSNALLRAASGPLRESVWGTGTDASMELAQILFRGGDDPHPDVETAP